MFTDSRLQKYSDLFTSLNEREWKIFWSAFAVNFISTQIGYLSLQESVPAFPMLYSWEFLKDILFCIDRILLLERSAHDNIEWLNEIAESARDNGIDANFELVLDMSAQAIEDERVNSPLTHLIQ